MSIRLRGLLVVSVLFFSIPLVCQSQTDTPKTTAPEKSQDALVIERLSTVANFEDDGTGSRKMSASIKMLSDAGVQEFGVLRLPYTSDNESLDISYVRVRKQDGTVVNTPAYNIQDLPAEVTQSAPMYSDVHEKHVTVKGLGVGDVLEYAIEYRNTKPVVPGHFWFAYDLAQFGKVNEETLELSVPKNKKVNVKSPGFKPEIREEGAKKIYFWKVTNVEAKQSPSNQAEITDTKPAAIQVSTFETWKQVGEWYGALQKPQLAITPELKAKADALTKGLTTDDEKIRAIYQFVSTRFHYVSLSFGIGRYQPHAAQEVLENEYGDCKDKHTLLSALLKAAGYDAWPALIGAGRKLDPDVPSPAQFNHVITVVPRGKDYTWLDTTPEVAPFGLLLTTLRDKQALLIPSTGDAFLVRTPQNPPFVADQSFVVTGKLGSDDVFQGHVVRANSGDFEYLLRAAFRRVSQAQWKDIAQQVSYVSGFAGEVSNVAVTEPNDLSAPFHFSYDYTRKEFGDWANRRITAPLPVFGLEYLKDKPKEPLFLGAPGDFNASAVVQFPEGATVTLPPAVNAGTDYLEYHSRYSFDKGVLKTERHFRVKKSMLPVAAWEELKKFQKTVTDDEGAWIDVHLPGDKTGSADTNGNNANSGSDEAARLFSEGTQALQRSDNLTAETDLRRVLELNPKNVQARGMLAWISLRRNDVEGALQLLRQGVELEPENPRSHQALAFVLTQLGRTSEAAEQWRTVVKLDPENQEAQMGLGTALYRQEQYPEAINILSVLHQQNPTNASAAMLLGNSYLRTGDKNAALSAWKSAIEHRTNSETLNSVAYMLAEANMDLDEAKEWSRQSIEDSARHSKDSKSEQDGLMATMQLAMRWDTLGWIYYKLGDNEKALTYLKASWVLSQDPVVGDHLGQVYEKQGKTSAAAHQYLLASNLAPPGARDSIREHYEHLTGKELEDATRPSFKRGASQPYTFPGAELSEMRTVRVASAHAPNGTAVFSVIFDNGKLSTATVVSGNEKMKNLQPALLATKFVEPVPEGEDVKIYRRGVLSCTSTTGCNFVFLLPKDVNTFNMQ